MYNFFKAIVKTIISPKQKDTMPFSTWIRLNKNQKEQVFLIEHVINTTK